MNHGHRPMTSTTTTTTNATSSRILTDVPCKVCHDNSSGKHYGIFACDGCAGFFKRSIRRNRQYVCKNHGLGNCPVDKTHRNQCRSCRLTRCLEAGMNKEAVQHERGPRNSTIRRQMALLLKESSDLITAYHHQHYRNHHHHHPMPTNFHHPLDLRRTIVETPVQIGLPSVGSTGNVDTQESAARILFNAINWTKTVPAFVSLSTHDQLSLLEEAWRDLFLLTAAEQQLIIDERSSAVKQSDITSIRTLIQTCQQLDIDANEYICLKSLVLFRTCRTTSTDRHDLSSIAYLQDQAKILLNTYINKQYPSQPHRFSKFIQLLSNLRSISSLTIEDLFFRQTIGEQTHMEQLVKDMYQINMASIVAQTSI